MRSPERLIVALIAFLLVGGGIAAYLFFFAESGEATLGGARRAAPDEPVGARFIAPDQPKGRESTLSRAPAAEPAPSPGLRADAAPAQPDDQGKETDLTPAAEGPNPSLPAAPEPTPEDTPEEERDIFAFPYKPRHKFDFPPWMLEYDKRVRAVGPVLSDNALPARHPSGMFRARKKRLDGPSATASTARHGLVGEYRILDSDPRRILVGGGDPFSATSTAYGTSFSRIDETIDFPTYESFGFYEIPRNEGIAVSVGNIVVSPLSIGRNIAARWKGLLYMERDSRITFVLGNDSGGALKINGEAVVVNSRFNWYHEFAGEIELEAGFHEIGVEHLDFDNPLDVVPTSICKLMWLPPGGAKPLPVPTEWLFPTEDTDFSLFPDIAALEPARAEIGEELTIRGRRLTREVEHGGERQTLIPKVYIDGILAPVNRDTAREDRLTVEVPVGADSGTVVVEQERKRGRAAHLDVTTRFGLVVSVWDLSNYPLDFIIPETREPDWIGLVEQPFPLTPKSFPGLDPTKPMAVRLEGEVAMYFPPLPERDLLSSQVIVSTKEFTPDISGQVKAKLTVGADTMEFVSDDAAAIAQQPPVHFYYFFFPDFTSRWLPFTYELVFDGEQAQARYPIVGASPRRADFRPNFVPPSPPRLFVKDQNFPALPGLLPLEARVGERFEFYAGFNAADMSGPDAPHPDAVVFSVDGVPVADIARSDKPIELDFIDDAAGKFAGVVYEYALTIPEGAGEGVFVAHNGIARSLPLKLNLVNRGLTGFYYAFDPAVDIAELPDMTFLTPTLRRLDKTIRFPNAHDFALPFTTDRFGVEWFGSFRAESEGTYTFTIQSDDGCRLTVNDTMVLEFKGRRLPVDSTGSIDLAPGWHDVKVEFFENLGMEACTMWYQPPGAADKAFIPARLLSTKRERGVPDKIPPAGVGGG